MGAALRSIFDIAFIKVPSSWNFRQKMSWTHAVIDCSANAGSDDSGKGFRAAASRPPERRSLEVAYVIQTGKRAKGDSETDHSTRLAISRISFLRTASAKRCSSSAVMTKLPGPPVIRAAKAGTHCRHHDRLCADPAGP